MAALQLHRVSWIIIPGCTLPECVWRFLSMGSDGGVQGVTLNEILVI